MCLHSFARRTGCTKPRPHTQPITYNTIPQKDNMIPYLAQSRHPLNSQVLAIFFPFATIPATPHYPVFTDRYSPQYGMLTFLLHFMTNTFFSTFLPLSPPLLPPRYWIIQPVQSRARYHPWLLTQISVIPPPSSLSHSPDLGCVGAQRIMFLGRFLV